MTPEAAEGETDAARTLPPLLARLPLRWVVRSRRSGMSSVVNIRRRPGAAHKGPVLLADAEDDDEPMTVNELFMYMYLPTVLFVMGLAEGVLAWAFRHWLGMVPAAVAAPLGVWLLAKRPPKAGQGWRRIALIGLMLLLGALLFVRIISTKLEVDFELTQRARMLPFPQRCAPHKLAGCKRVALKDPHPTEELPPRFAVATEDAVRAVQNWARRQVGGRLLNKRYEPEEALEATNSTCTVFLHFRMITPFWGFVDDFFVNVECVKPPDRAAAAAAAVQVSVQSHLRFGDSDFGTNAKRVEAFLRSLRAELEGLPRVDCAKQKEDHPKAASR